MPHAKTGRFEIRADASQYRRMLVLLMVVFRGLALVLRGHQELVLEHLALQQQLAAMERSTKGPQLLTRDLSFAKTGSTRVLIPARRPGTIMPC